MKALVLVAAGVAALVLSTTTTAAQRGTATLTVRSSSFGKVLFDGRGFVLYAFTKDARRSACSGACARKWPPYVAHGSLHAGPNVNRSLLGTVRRANGAPPVTYGGRPLYYYVGDSSPGQILCQNVSEFGGLWLIVRPSGKLVR